MEQSNTIPAERDFLDLRCTLTELASSAFMLTLCVFLSLFAASFLFVIYSQRVSISIAGLVSWGLSFLIVLLTCGGAWLLYAQAKKDKFIRPALRLMRVLPIVEAVFCVIACLFMAALLVVVLFSNSMLQAGIKQIAEALSGSYFSFAASVLGTLAKLTTGLITAATVTAAIALALITLRVFFLNGFLRKLLCMQEKNKPLNSLVGFVAFLSYLIACAIALIGTSAAKTNLSGGICLSLFGGTLFASGLMLHKSAIELRFLCTYYAKLNRAVKKRADAIRAQKEALMNAPLAIPAPENAPTDAAQAEGESLPSAADAPDVIVVPEPDIQAPEAPDVIVPGAEEALIEAKEETEASSQNIENHEQGEENSQNSNIPV